MLKKYIKQFIPPILIKLLKPKKREEEMEYSIGRHKLRLPPGHTLPKYQRMHRLFDRFLPILAEFADPTKMIVDIGANVGDTALMMHQNNDVKIMCVEPSDKFFPYLEQNIGRLGDDFKGQFLLKKTMVGTSDFHGTLEHYDGTAKFVEGSSTENLVKIPLDQLLENVDVGLIKVDTDGYDFDVLNSGLEVLKSSLPILFWENQMENESQSKGYEKLYSNLEQLGYKYIFIFDNFGNLMLENTNFVVLRKVNKYVDNMSNNGNTRTLYFTDVLAATEENKERVHEAIKKYKREWVKK